MKLIALESTALPEFQCYVEERFQAKSRGILSPIPWMTILALLPLILGGAVASLLALQAELCSAR